MLLLTGTWAFAGEFAVLRNGFRLHAERHEPSGERILLYSTGGVTDIAAADVSCFEVEEYTPPPPPAAPAIPGEPATAIAATPREFIAQSAGKHKIPVALIESVVAAESAYRVNALSPKGAIGLMQLMPGTARQLGVDPRSPAQNVDGGTEYLRELLAKYEDSDDQVARAVAAYNAGPGAVDRYHGIPPYRETQQYVRRVLNKYAKDAKASAGAVQK